MRVVKLDSCGNWEMAVRKDWASARATKKAPAARKRHKIESLDILMREGDGINLVIARIRPDIDNGKISGRQGFFGLYVVLKAQFNFSGEEGMESRQ
jgi:hypothetical protein